MPQIQLSMKNAMNIQGTFVVPDYQRGYKWQPQEVRQLLDDVYENENERYCLQAIVVHNYGGKLQLIDGQQRLTTILLIRAYLDSCREQNDKNERSAKYTLEFDTREQSKDFLDNISEKALEDGNENPDFWHLVHAYKEIELWFSEEEHDRSLFERKLGQTFVIWSETSNDGIGADETFDRAIGEATFNRLNYGKIDLTDAELIKAMFLSANNGNEDKLSDEQKLEIALQWDDIERKLQDDEFWYFLTKRIQSDNEEDASGTRIDLLLDLIANNRTRKRRTTFAFFADKWLSSHESMLLGESWKTIHRAYLALCSWFEDQKLYHKIGYLIECDDIAIEEKAACSLFDIYQAWIDSDNDAGFHVKLDAMIRASIPLKRMIGEHGNRGCVDIAFGDLSYEDPQTKNALLLFNVLKTEGSQKTDASDDTPGTARFPFALYKESKWELEHIHAQNSELPTKRNDLIKYARELENLLRNGELPLETMHRKNLLEELETERANLESNNNKTLASLTDMCNEVVSLIMQVDNSEQPLDEVDENRISNLALLEKRDNILISNHVFLIKRFFLIQQDRRGKYIPLGTRHTFLKYYAKSEEGPREDLSTSDSFNEQHLAWTREDRDAYLAELEHTLSPYVHSSPAPSPSSNCGSGESEHE